MSKMNWKQLNKNKCPQCNSSKLLDFYDALTKVLGCSTCGFRITEKKFKEIVNDRVIRDIEQENKQPEERSQVEEGYGI